MAVVSFFTVRLLRIRVASFQLFTSLSTARLSSSENLRFDFLHSTSVFESEFVSRNFSI